MGGMSVVVKGVGLNDNIESQVDSTFQAGRQSLRPTEYQGQAGATQGGHFGVGAQTGLTTGIAAAGILFSFRWSDSARLALLHKILVGATVTTGYGTAQAVDVDAVVVRGFTASDTGQTAISMSANSGKKRTSMGNSLVGDLRIAGTAAIGAGTGTADTNAFAAVAVPTNVISATVGATGQTTLFQVAPGAESPVVLAANEGFRLRVLTAQGATGVVRYTFTVDWAEVPSF